MLNKILNYLNDVKNIYRIFFFIVVFLCIVKLPPLITADIQPWDEGMYAARVLSISENGDFIDQSSHSVGKFYSGSHPPLLIWIGYFSSLIFGLNSVTLKMIPFIFSLLCLLLLILIGKEMFSPLAGITAALIFSGNIIFNIFSKRFQFDIPYTFFILLSFYFFLLYLSKKKTAYNILGGVAFGLCLMVKILVGFYIPIIIFIFYLFTRKKTGYRFTDLLIFSLTGIIISLPWHLYMLSAHGTDFLDYFFRFHIFDRAFSGVEHNTKGSGYFYHINYLLSIIPFGILIFISTIKDFIEIKIIGIKKLFLVIWFLTGLVIITLFKTKLEVYILLILAPGSLLLAEYLLRLNDLSAKEKNTIIFLTALNIIWSITLILRDSLQYRELLFKNIFIVSTVMLISGIVLFFVIKLISDRITIVNFYYLFIFLFCTGINVYYLFRVPEWEDTYRIREVKEMIETGGSSGIIYISPNYRANPQLSFYFNGIDLGWGKCRYRFELLETKNGTDKIINRLSELRDKESDVIVETDNINRSEYTEAGKFIPGNFRLIYKTRGYELYRK
ncbi:MAG: glycosyltransferase family 39 protein [Ignavibacteriae bacterium]|nr:glycosyltransferase family 39 protein [Ignavibacteriota bacterium]